MKEAILTIMTAGALLITQSISQARIGWTLEQCRERYGKETNIHAPGTLLEVIEFRTGNFFIGCSFLDDKVASVYYFKEGADWGKKFSDEELNDLLEKNGNGCLWKPEGDNGSEHQKWVQEMKAWLTLWTAFRDGQPVMSADYGDDSSADKPRPTFSVHTIEYRKAFHENLQKRGKEMTQQEVQAWVQEQKARDAKQREKRKESADKATEGL